MDEVILTAPLEDGDFRYFTDHILPSLRPLSDEEYMTGPAAILHTFARSSYILYRDDVYWCVEWQPGLIVIRFSPYASMAWTAIRSPNPYFGGREPLPEDLRDYDEDAENHQVNLVFTAWDAQFDADEREYRSFRPAAAPDESAYRAALVHVDELGESMKARYSNDDVFSEWLKQCKNNLRAWTGEGIRVR